MSVSIRLLRFAIVAACALLAAPEPCGAQSRIVNGVTSHAYPTTGALLYDSDGLQGPAALRCTGTLIGCNTFLTAAHCVIADSDPAHYFVFLQHAGVFGAESIVPHDDYRSETFPIADVAVIRLKSAVTGIDPTPINTTANPVAFLGTRGTIIGFGQTLGTAGNYGIKRVGQVTTESCFPQSVPQGVTNTTSVCWSYALPVGSPGTDSNTCNGDSGGPLLLDLGAGEVVAGVTSGGTNGNCNTTDHSYDANVYTYRAFITERLGGDSTVACASIPAVGTPGTSVIGHEGTLASGNLDDSYIINVSSHANVGRFVLNAEDNGSLDADLYVKYGAPAGPTSYDCKADGAGNFGACEFELPALGEWHVFVRRAAGAGAYQLTTTVFGGPPPVCGNETTETGEACEDAQDQSCPGLCNSLACTCPVPSCGNGVAESGEACDGTSAAACLSGACQTDCTCVPACGDGRCDAGETARGCSEDCGCSAPGSCPYRVAPAGCYCDSACVMFGDCCPDACVSCDACIAGCGNGVVEFGEECDDGNLVDGDCCSSGCAPEPAGSACDDGSLCTPVDQCDGFGECVGEAAIATGCMAADRAVIKIEDAAVSSRDRLKWSWLRKSAIDVADLGDPTSSTVYDVCVYDLYAGQATLAVSAHLEPGARWSPRLNQGWTYDDSGATSDGVQKLSILTGNSSKVKLKARGVYLRLPGPISNSLYFRKDPGVVTQLRSSAGTCWTATLSGSLVSTGEKFLGKMP